MNSLGTNVYDTNISGSKYFSHSINTILQLLCNILDIRRDFTSARDKSIFYQYMLQNLNLLTYLQACYL